MMFWLGVGKVDWLARIDVPMMVSYRTLAGRKSLPRAAAPWIEDSGGFTELEKDGTYHTTAAEYAAAARRHGDEIGQLAHVAVQDWMCEDHVMTKTGLTVLEHQRRTTESWFDLNELAPEVPWMPVLQGRVLGDYLRHIEAYVRAGVNLAAAPLVGLGTVCRRQNAVIGAQLVGDLWRQTQLKLHAFGFKVTGILRARDWLYSTDSMAWSLDGRLSHGGRCAKVRDHAKCSNCLPYALKWRRKLMERLTQTLLWSAA